MPLLNQVAAERAHVLEPDGAFSIADLWGSDIQGRSTAMKTLTEAGAQPESTARAAGLEVEFRAEGTNNGTAVKAG